MNLELSAALAGGIVGALLALPISYALTFMQRNRDGKDRFLAVVSRQEALLERSREKLYTYYTDSVLVLHDAIFAVKPFVSETAFKRLKASWDHYKQRGQKEKQWHIRSDHGVLNKVFDASPTLSDKYADEWMGEFLGKFRKIVG
jgi:hypothetical protein